MVDDVPRDGVGRSPTVGSNDQAILFRQYAEAMGNLALGVAQRESPQGGDKAGAAEWGDPVIPPRLLLTRFLLGTGIELGPGHAPLDLPFGGAEVTYVDRWDPVGNRELFPELGPDAEFPQPGIEANLDVDKLGAVASESQDFVIASHLLEHLADPLGQLAEIHRVLRIGGVALILLPDRRFTFDLYRAPTALQHLIDDHRSGTTTVSDEHVEDFIRNTGGWQERWDLPEHREEKERLFDLHRRRSIHVHCWTEEEFVSVLVHTISAMGMRWNLEDALFVEDVPGAFEFGLVLRRLASSHDDLDCTRRMELAYEHLWQRSLASRAEPVPPPEPPPPPPEAQPEEAAPRRLYRKGRSVLHRFR